MKYCFGIDIGGTTVKMGFFSEEGTLLEKWEIPTRKGSNPEPLLEDIRDTIETLMKRRGISRMDILGVGMAAPGPVSEDGLLHGTVNIGWGDVYLGEQAEQALGMSPVLLGNDARVAALGEFSFGAGRGASGMLMLTLGTGVGGGVIHDGKIVTGKTGTAGEIGHMTVNPFETEACNCGKRGCLEQYASATGMVRLAHMYLDKTDAPSVLRTENPLTAKALWAAAQAADTAALEITAQVADFLGIAIANACYIVDSEIVVIGGGVSAAGEFLLNMIQTAYQRYVFAHCRQKRFALAQLRNDAGIYGAAAMVLRQTGK